MIPGVFFTIAVVGGISALIVFGVRAAKRSGIERNAALREMAARLGLEYFEEPPAAGFLPPSPAVRGMFGGRAARLQEFSRGSGKNRTRWVAARVQCAAAGAFKLSVRSQGPAIFEKIAGAFGYKDIVIGDTAFDSLLVVHGSDEEFIKAALIPEIRARIIAFWPKATGGRIVVEGGEAVYEEQGSFSRTKCREHLEKAFPVLGDMAAIAEVQSG